MGTAGTRLDAAGPRLLLHGRSYFCVAGAHLVLQELHVCVADRSSCNTLTYTAGVHLDAAAGKKLKICYLKIDVSYEASAKFHHMSQDATPATEFALGRHFAQPCQCDSLQNTQQK